VVLRKLRQFQQAGHQAVVIIGDWTAQIGDPTGRDKTRQSLTHQEVKKNARMFFDQIFCFLDRPETEIRWQSDWFKNLSLDRFFDLLSKTSVHELLAHETFGRRLTNHQPLATHELLYPILQGYDSVAVNADVEIGAIEQKFNLLMGRLVQKVFGHHLQDIVMTPFLTGIDGHEKMSKSLGNAINLMDFPQDVYGKIMSIPDHLIVEYFTLCTDLTDKALEIVKDEVKTQPRQAKDRLAFLITEMLYDERSAESAQQAFNLIHRDRQIPQDLPEIRVNKKIRLVDLIVTSQLAPSRSAARRLIAQGGVRLGGTTQLDPDEMMTLADQQILRVGKRKFVRVRLN